MEMELGTVKFFNNRDDKRFGFIVADTGDEVFFHLNNGVNIKIESVKGLWRQGFGSTYAYASGKFPKNGDRLIFKREEGRKGPKACFWAFMSEYELALKQCSSKNSEVQRGGIRY